MNFKKSRDTQHLESFYATRTFWKGPPSMARKLEAVEPCFNSIPSWKLSKVIESAPIAGKTWKSSDESGSNQAETFPSLEILKRLCVCVCISVSTKKKKNKRRKIWILK